MKNIAYFVLVFLVACAPKTRYLQYEIFSIGTDSSMTASEGYVKLRITQKGEFSRGFIDIKSDSLKVIDSVITSNYSTKGTEFIDISLMTSGNRIIMYEGMWGIFKKDGEKAVIFFEGKPKLCLRDRFVFLRKVYYD
jgi:hypothetical protein